MNFKLYLLSLLIFVALMGCGASTTPGVETTADTPAPTIETTPPPTVVAPTPSVAEDPEPTPEAQTDAEAETETEAETQAPAIAFDPSQPITATIATAEPSEVMTGTDILAEDTADKTVPSALAEIITPTVTITDTETVTPKPQIHIVTENESLFYLSYVYSTTVDALLEANNLTENDFLQIGQELIIPTLESESEVAADNDPFDFSVELTNTVDLLAPDNAVTETTEVVTPTTTTTDSNDETSTVVPETPTSTEQPTDNTATDSTGSPVAPIANLPDIADVTVAENINPLTGLPVADPTVLQRRPILVRIGNDVGARQSQAGFNQADMVYEEITEWWVTRFTAIFLSETPPMVAPIRSARLINVLLTPQYQGALAHSGGSDPVRWEISQAPLVNLDEFFSPAPYFYRPNQGWQTRLAINLTEARDYMTSQGTEAAVTVPAFRFNPDAPTGGEPAAYFSIPYPSATSFTEWQYNSSTGRYGRLINGSPLLDANDGQAVSAANVVVYFAEHLDTDIVEDSNGATAIRMQVNGQGPAMFFRDGLLNRGFWVTDGTRPPYFMYEDGTPYELKPGNTWVQVVPTYYEIELGE